MQDNVTDSFYRDLFDNLNEAIVILDPKNELILDCNRACEKIFGYGITRIKGKEIAYFLNNPDKFAKFKKNFITSSEKRDLNKVELQMRKKGNQTFWGELIFNHIYPEQGPASVLVIIIRDISVTRKFETSWIRMQEQLRSLASHIQEVREEERIHVARELHDELSPVLTVLKMGVVGIANKLEKENSENRFSDLLEKTASMENSIDCTIDLIRKIIAELRPGILDDLGLIPAIEWLLEDFQKKTGMPFTIESNVEDVKLIKEQTTAVFRIVQESVSNAIRHGKARGIKVILEKKKSYFRVTVSDNGIGIKESELFGRKSFGIMGMRERTEHFGWEISITGKKGLGTVVKLQIPLGRNQ